MRNGYDPKDLAALLTAKPSEIKLLLRDQLEPTRAEELLSDLVQAGFLVRREGQRYRLPSSV